MSYLLRTEKAFWVGKYEDEGGPKSSKEGRKLGYLMELSV